MNVEKDNKIKLKIVDLIRNGEKVIEVKLSHGECANFGILKSKDIDTENFFIIGNILKVYQEGEDEFGFGRIGNHQYYELSDDEVKQILSK